MVKTVAAGKLLCTSIIGTYTHVYSIYMACNLFAVDQFVRTWSPKYVW